MRLLGLLGWGCGLWGAACLEAALGGGMPGPLLLLTLAAGLRFGTRAGVLVGFLAGASSAAITGHGLLLACGVAITGGAVVSLLPRWFAHRHILIGLATAFLASGLASLLLSLCVRLPLGEALLVSLQRAGVNCLWMIPIYGIVLVVSSSSTTTASRWDV